MDPFKLVVEEVLERTEAMPFRSTTRKIEQPTGYPRTVTTNRLLQELHDIRYVILETLNREAEQRKQEMDQRRKEHEELKASMERLTTVVLECQTRIGVAETRIRGLQEARRDTYINTFRYI